MKQSPVAHRDYPAALREERAWFSTDDDCLSYLDWLRWGDGFCCPKCGCERCTRVRPGLRRCRGCDRRVSVTAGTIFQGTRTPLTVWFEAAWHMATKKNGISAQDLSRLLPVGSYQTCWSMQTKFRRSLESAGKEKLSGTVEIDEWFHGGVAVGGNAFTGKTLVIAALEVNPRGKGYGRLRLGIIENRSVAALRKFIRANVEPGTHVITDGLVQYASALAGYTHEPRNESAPNAPQAHTLLPGVHRVFSLCERWLLGTHQGGVQKEHLQEYLDEFIFRWNRRKADSRGLLFLRLLEHAVGAQPVRYTDLVRIGRKPTVKDERVTPTHGGGGRLPQTLEVRAVHHPWLR